MFTTCLGVGWVALAKDAPQRVGAVERGYRVAARECAMCHAIDDRSDSPRIDAPPFREIRRRYNAASLARELDAIRKVGHFEMPAKPISKTDGQDLIEYLESWGDNAPFGQNN